MINNNTGIVIINMMLRLPKLQVYYQVYYYGHKEVMEDIFYHGASRIEFGYGCNDIEHITAAFYNYERIGKEDYALS